jgi:hypothetical protein
MRTMMLIAAVSAVLAGCSGASSSDPYASVATSQKSSCESTGGTWNTLTTECDWGGYTR